jgi:hypothetical protein
MATADLLPSVGSPGDRRPATDGEETDVEHRSHRRSKDDGRRAGVDAVAIIGPGGGSPDRATHQGPVRHG